MSRESSALLESATHVVTNCGEWSRPVYAGNGPTTVAEALAVGGLSATTPGKEAWLNGRVAAPDDIAPRGSEVTLAPRVRGG